MWKLHLHLLRGHLIFWARLAKWQLHAVHGGPDTPKLSAVSQVAGIGGHHNVETTPPPLEGTDAMAHLEPPFPPEIPNMN